MKGKKNGKISNLKVVSSTDAPEAVPVETECANAVAAICAQFDCEIVLFCEWRDGQVWPACQVRRKVPQGAGAGQ